MLKDEIIKRTIAFVKESLETDKSGHDWYHIERVYKLAQFIAKEEQGDVFIISLAALLHDIKDHKFTGGDSEIGANIAYKFVTGIGVSEAIAQEVYQIILNMSYKGGLNKDKVLSKEGMIVQDADRIDAIGAIGIARTFTYGGNKNRVLYDPTIEPQEYHDVKSYIKNNSTTINHFYEKLLKLKDLMNTETGKKIANKRHKIMEDYLTQFYKEWNSEDIL